MARGRRILIGVVGVATLAAMPILLLLLAPSTGVLASTGDRYETNNERSQAARIASSWTSNSLQYDLEISDHADEDWFQFETSQGAEIKVKIYADKSGLTCRLYDPSGPLWLGSRTTDGTGYELIWETAPVTGTYYLRFFIDWEYSRAPIKYRVELLAPSLPWYSTTTTTYRPPTSTTSTTTVSPGGSVFSDVPEWHAYATQIGDLAARGIVSGYANGTFCPYDRVTRQQFAKMMVLTCGYPVSVSDICPFSDVQKTSGSTLYPDHYVAVCATQGITKGATAGKFQPYDKVTREQLITMVVRAAGVPDAPEDYEPPFIFRSKFSSGEHYINAAKASAAALLEGLQSVNIEGYTFTTFATRGEVCVLLHNLLGYWGSVP